MATTTGELKQWMGTLNMTEAAHILEESLLDAESKDWSCGQFLHHLLGHELRRREEKQRAKRMKWASFPFIKSLDDFRLEEQQSLSKRHMEQLRELLWLEHTYNLILLGPPGVGKTHLSVGLGMEALERGHRVSFVAMDNLIHLLKTQEIARTSQTRMKRILGSDLVIIDDLMFMAMEKSESNLFFQFVNKLYGQASIILTSNKGPEDWGELLGDPAITTAILDRILHKSEVIKMSGDSFRLKHRETIFGNV
ncbi:ATP-binding protein [Paenibacillus dendritiformis]|uniref:IS21-like element helper ATPase IstB n=1 Tax=Paenibacillus dendritiformis TaxID=130049 RepID=UPI0018CE04AB|nr:ATP-binding protein [Paenibacillus dendritiformis]MBG9794828.1 ATP-binding protein [Paenibacillus dendritiformis]